MEKSYLYEERYETLLKQIKDKEMERHEVFMDWETQYRKDVVILQINL